MSHLANHNALRHSRTRSGADSWLRSLFALGIVVQLAGCALPFFGGGSSSDPGDGAVSTQDIAAELDKADRNAALEPEEPYWLYRQAELHLFEDGWAEATDALIRSLVTSNSSPGPAS